MSVFQIPHDSHRHRNAFVGHFLGAGKGAVKWTTRRKSITVISNANTSRVHGHSHGRPTENNTKSIVVTTRNESARYATNHFSELSHTSLFIPSCGDQAISIFTIACRLYQRSEPFADLYFLFVTVNCVVARWPTAESSILSCNRATGVTPNTSVSHTSLFTCICFSQLAPLFLCVQTS